MNINVLTIFPKIFDILNSGVVSRAIKSKTLSINTKDIRKNAVNKHNQVDARPYGGGEGMVMMAEPIIKSLSQINKNKIGKVIYLSPQGKKLNQRKIVSLSKLKNITLICGRYEGIDQRVIDKYVDEEISVGDFVMSGGEYPAICLIDAIARNLPGTVGNEDSVKNDSFFNGLLKGPAYTRPEIFEDDQVPDVLLSGNHSRISEWKANKSLIQTYLRRPDLINKVKLTKKQKKLLEEIESKDIL